MKNTNRRTTTTFDLRPVDFQSGKRLALPNDQKINCECCGRKIAKGVNLASGEKVGTECGVVSDHLRTRDEITKRGAEIMRISQKQADFFGVTII